MIYQTIRNSSKNQSTADYNRENLFIAGNRYQEGTLLNNLGEKMEAKNGFLVTRNQGSFERAAFEFADLANGATVIIAGLTYTASGATLAATVAAAFANRAAGYAGTGTLAGTLTDYSTGPVLQADEVVFTATTVGNKTDLAATGTGSVSTTTIINGAAGTLNAFSPATPANLADVIGVLNVYDVDLEDAETTSAHYAVCGDIDTSLLILPVGATLDTPVGNKALKDILTGLGFVLFNVVENTKFDN